MFFLFLGQFDEEKPKPLFKWISIPQYYRFHCCRRLRRVRENFSILFPQFPGWRTFNIHVNNLPHDSIHHPFKLEIPEHFHVRRCSLRVDENQENWIVRARKPFSWIDNLSFSFQTSRERWLEEWIVHEAGVFEPHQVVLLFHKCQIEALKTNSRQMFRQFLSHNLRWKMISGLRNKTKRLA